MIVCWKAILAYSYVANENATNSIFAHMFCNNKNETILPYSNSMFEYHSYD